MIYTYIHTWYTKDLAWGFRGDILVVFRCFFLRFVWRGWAQTPLAAWGGSPRGRLEGGWGPRIWEKRGWGKVGGWVGGWMFRRRNDKLGEGILICFVLFCFVFVWFVFSTPTCFFDLHLNVFHINYLCLYWDADFSIKQGIWREKKNHFGKCFFPFSARFLRVHSSLFFIFYFFSFPRFRLFSSCGWP